MLRKHLPNPAQPNHSNAHPSQTHLAGRPEDTGLSILRGMDPAHDGGCRPQSEQLVSWDNQLIKRRSRPVREPQIASRSQRRADDSSDQTTRKLPYRRIPPLVTLQIHARESNTVSSSVIVEGQVGETLLSRHDSGVSHEVR